MVQCLDLYPLSQPHEPLFIGLRYTSINLYLGILWMYALAR